MPRHSATKTGGVVIASVPIQCHKHGHGCCWETLRSPWGSVLLELKILPPSSKPHRYSGKSVTEWSLSIFLAETDPSPSYLLLGALRSKQSIYLHTCQSVIQTGNSCMWWQIVCSILLFVDEACRLHDLLRKKGMVEYSGLVMKIKVATPVLGLNPVLVLIQWRKLYFWYWLS